jgi:hypothetical protein
MSGLRDFKKVAGGDENFSKLQERLQEFFAPLMINPTLNGTLLTNVVLTTGVTNVNHRLGRPPQGWIVVRKNSNADIWEPTQNFPKSFIELQASAPVTISLWVF